MRRLLRIALLTLCLLPTAVRAAGPDDSARAVMSLLEQASAQRLEADYSFALVRGGTPVLCSGHAVVQTPMFRISGNGVEIYCDGVSLRYLDPQAREEYIEPAVGLEDYLKENIADIRDFKASNIVITPRSDSRSMFEAPQTGSDWVVTDLR